MIEPNQAPPAPGADQAQEAAAEVPDTTGGQSQDSQDRDHGIDIVQDLTPEDAILDQDLDLLLGKVLDTKEKENDLVHPRRFLKKGLTAIAPKLCKNVILLEMVSVLPPPRLPAMTTDRRARPRLEVRGAAFSCPGSQWRNVGLRSGKR